MIVLNNTQHKKYKHPVVLTGLMVMAFFIGSCNDHAEPEKAVPAPVKSHQPGQLGRKRQQPCFSVYPQ